MKFLFICNAGINRSRRAAELWKKKNPTDEVEYLGISTAKITKDILRNFDKIFVMEEKQKKALQEIAEHDFGICKKIIVLEILDIYDYGTKALDKELEKRLFHTCRET